MNQLTEPVDPILYREAMSRLVAPVHIVTTDGPAGRRGLTASAMTSVSDNPPTVLVCVNRNSKNNDALKVNLVFCINTLDAAEQGLSDAFSGRLGLEMDERFARAVWATLSTGSPVLETARASFDCRVTDIVEQNSHTVFFGRVEAVRIGGRGAALVYLDRKYRTIEEI